jgi:hypothetical protein
MLGKRFSGATAEALKWALAGFEICPCGADIDTHQALAMHTRQHFEPGIHPATRKTPITWDDKTFAAEKSVAYPIVVHICVCKGFGFPTRVGGGDAGQ